MQVINTELEGVKIIQPKVHADERGYFLETYNADRYAQQGIDVTFVQDNQSRSGRGTLRGLHYQVEHAQDKLVWAIIGEAWDVAVDMRKDSPTFGRHVSVMLSAEKKNQIFVPKGFAHGFCAISDVCEIVYKCSDRYHQPGEAGVIWNDPELGIEWPVTDPILSPKDLRLPRFADARVF